jgi:tetratricopeptide (TPR) repeat protein
MALFLSRALAAPIGLPVMPLRSYPSFGGGKRFRERIAVYLLVAEFLCAGVGTFLFAWEWAGRTPIEQQRQLNVLPGFLASALRFVIGPSAESLGVEGQNLLASGEPKLLERAVEAFNSAIRLKPQPKLFHLRGEAYKAMKDRDHAMQDYSHAIELDKKFAPAFFQRAQLKFDEKDFAGAARDLEDFIVLEPRNDDALVKLGDIYMEMGSAELARVHYGKAVGVNSGNSQARYKLSQEYYRTWLGNKKPAFALWINPRKPPERRLHARRLDDDEQWNRIWMKENLADPRFGCIMPIHMCLRLGPHSHNPFGCRGTNQNRCRARHGHDCTPGRAKLIDAQQRCDALTRRLSLSPDPLSRGRSRASPQARRP